MTRNRAVLPLSLEPDAQAATERLLKQVVDHVPVALWAIDQNCVITLSTGLGLRGMGLSQNQLLGRSLNEFTADNPHFMTHIRSVLQGKSGSWQGSFGPKRYDTRCAPLLDSQGQVTGAIAVSIDITERYEQEAQLMQLAYSSSLTGLPNRAQLVEWLGDALASHYPVALVHFDLDHFRRINESFGRVLGDQLIRAAGNRLLEVLPSNAKLAHLGGDHFAAVLPTQNDGQATARMAKLALDAFRGPLQLDQGTFFCTLSAGIADMAGDTPDDWLNRAEIALHHAKDAGRNRCLSFRDEFIEHIREDTRIYLELRKALDLGLLEVHYEPQVSLLNRRIVGFEALTRWRHPPLVSVPISDTIRVAEESGLIREITRLVLEQVYQHLQQWRVRLGPRLPCISINVNSDEFVDPSFLQMIDALLARDSNLASCLRIELTESAMMASPSEARRVLLELRQRGVMASLDDFGTGFSSLSLLHELPVDELKIDRSLVPSLSNPVPTSLVHTVMAMANLLRLRTTVEGIETREQENLMTQLGCEHAQGFLYSRALTSQAACDMAAAYPSPFSTLSKGST